MQEGIEPRGNGVHFRIRIKFIGILVIAAVVPLCIALIAAHEIGYRYYSKAQGMLFETMAQQFAYTLSLSINTSIEASDYWVTHAGLHSRLNKGKEVGRQLEIYRSSDPLLAEMLLADANGEVVASTGTDGRRPQNGKSWWQATMALKAHQVYVEGINYNEAAHAYCFDVCLPVCDPDRPDAKAMGAVKVSVGALPLFKLLDPVMPRDQNIGLVVQGNSQIASRVRGQEIVPLEQALSAQTIRAVTKGRVGWTLAEMEEARTYFVGYAALRLTQSFEREVARIHTSPIRVLVYESAPVVLAPVHRQLWLLGGAGTLLVAVCLLAGYYIAGQKIIAPIEVLRSAAHRVADSAKLEDYQGLKESASPPASILGQIDRIHTGDEIEELSHEFSYMATRVLSYHKQLETELAVQTAEMQGDLKMAREFQEALMPRRYPEVPAIARPGGLRLNFHHVYRPASTVGGDFFDVIKLSDHRAGIFIADVMGHGTRSALITAILRTLLQDLANDSQEPAEFLRVINRHFHGIVLQTDELLFASAFYLILDTENATASYASAGHPSPLLIERCRQKVSPLIAELKDNPALGIFADSAYASHTKTITEGDLFLLFTDGVYEAADVSGEEFGQSRLLQIVSARINCEPREITQAVVDEVTRFLGHVTPPDDICLVAAEVARAPKPVQRNK